MNKNQIVEHIKFILQSKIDGLNNELTALHEDLGNNSKSSAGDKHETGRAMIHLEQERLGKQLQDLQQQRITFQSIDFAPKNSIGVGSLVKTNLNVYFLSLPLGVIELGNDKIISLSIASPFGRILNGKKLGDSVEFNGLKQEIKVIS